jgi:DnaJ-class molecular chaperone
MTCTLCKGSGALFDHDGTPLLWTCPKCGGCGAQVQYGPRFIGPGSRWNRRSEGAGE